MIYSWPLQFEEGSFWWLRPLGQNSSYLIWEMQIFSQETLLSVQLYHKIFARQCLHWADSLEALELKSLQDRLITLHRVKSGEGSWHCHIKRESPGGYNFARTKLTFQSLLPSPFKIRTNHSKSSFPIPMLPPDFPCLNHKFSLSPKSRYKMDFV
jgi:hypothetical protein